MDNFNNLLAVRVLPVFVSELKLRHLVAEFDEFWGDLNGRGTAFQGWQNLFGEVMSYFLIVVND